MGNLIVDHLFRLELPKYEPELSIQVSILDEQLFNIKSLLTLWYAYFVNYLVSGIMPYELSRQ